MPTLINLSRFDLTSLRVFLATIEGGSLTAGAERFGISVAAASKRVAELEAHIGSPLLTRCKRGIEPTLAGMTLRRHAIEVIAELEQLAVAMRDFQRGAGGHLSLWANTSAFTGFLPDLIAAYSIANPSVKLDLEDALSSEVVRAVARGNAELGVISGNTPTEGLESLCCDTDELVLLMPADHPLAVKDEVKIEEALSHDIVGLNRATALMRQIAAAADLAGRVLTVRIQVQGFDVVCRMIAVGLGIGILPHNSAAPLAKTLGLKIARLAGMPVKREQFLVMRDRETLSLPAKAFLELVEARANPPF